MYQEITPYSGETVGTLGARAQAQREPVRATLATAKAAAPAAASTAKATRTRLLLEGAPAVRQVDR